MAKNNARRRLYGLFLLCLMILNGMTGCFQGEDASAVHPLDVFGTYREMLVFEVIENRKDELVFDVALEDFISCYNAYYQRDKHSDYLLPVSRWSRETYDSGVHSSHSTIYYEFSEDPQKWLLPTVTVYVPTNADAIQEITVNFDDHGFTWEMYDKFTEISFYTCKVLFPDLPDDKIKELINALIDAAYEDEADEWYSFGFIPGILYIKSGIGVYSYFGTGQMLRLCVIPVNEQLLNLWRQSGTTVCKI